MQRSSCRPQLVFFGLISILSCFPPTLRGQEPTTPTQYLEAALKVENWLASVQRTNVDGRVYWPTNPDESDAFSFDSYHGFSGVIGFYLRLYDVTQDKKYLQHATDGADHFLHKIDQLDAKEPLGLYTGVAGYGQIMISVWQSTNHEKHKQAVIKCIEHLESRAKTKDSYIGDACHFDGVTDAISGSAGIIHFLVFAHRTLESQAALKLAIRCGDGLIEDGINTVSGDKNTDMLHWRMSDQMEREYPNVSHGTAGVCGALMELDEAVKADCAIKDVDYNNRFIDAAVKGAEYLKSVATINENQCLVFHHTPGGEDLYYLGWCHGPPGTSALLIGLAERTNDAELRRLGFLGAKALVKFDLSRNRTPGFWNNVGQCCGTAGVANFLSGMFRKTGDEIYLQECRKLTDDLLQRATAVKLSDGKVGLKWLQAEHRVRPDELKAQSGYMQGASGIGQWLLEMHQLESRINR